MKFQAIIAACLCAALASPSAAQMRVAAGVTRVPAGINVVPALGVSGLSAAPSLNSVLPAASLVSSLSPVAAPAPVVAGAVVPALPVAAIPMTAAVAKAVSPAVLVSAAPASSREFDPSQAPTALRAEGEQFWSGAAAKPETEDSVPADAPAALTPAAPPAKTSRLARVAGALAVPALPALHAISATLPKWISAAVPYAEGAAALGGAWALSRAARWTIDKLAPRAGWDKQDVVVRRFLSGVGLGMLGVVVAVSLVDVPSTALAAIGAGGTIVALAITPVLRDVLGNLFHGVHFLLARPFRIGDKVTIGKITGVVDDMTMRYLVLKDESGGIIKMTHNIVAGAAVTVHGRYEIKKLKAPALWKPVVFSALAIAALSFLPMLQTAIKGAGTEWLSVILPYVKGGLILTLTSGLSRVIQAGIQRTGWSRPVKMAGKLGAAALSWIVGIAFLIATSGITSAWLAGTLPLVIVGIAVNDYVSAAIQLVFLLTDKTYQIGDRVKIGEHEGAVLDITMQDIVLSVDKDTFMRIPHAVAKDSAIVKLPPVTPPQDSKEK